LFYATTNDPARAAENSILPTCFGEHVEHVQPPSDFNSNSETTSANRLGDNAQVVQDEAFIKSKVVSRVPPPNLTSSDFAAFVDHPIRIAHGTITAANTGTVNVTNDLFAFYLAEAALTPLGRKLENLSFAHATLRIKVVIQGQPFAAGQVVFAFAPRVFQTGYATVTETVQRSKVARKIVPHLVIDPSKSETYELDLPCPNPVGFYSLKDTNFGSYFFTIDFYNPLISGTAVAPSIGYCVYMSLVDPIMEGLTLLSADFVAEKSEGGTLSTFIKKAGQIAPLGAIAFPEIAPFTTLFSAVSGPVGDFLAMMGFSKPPVSEVSVIPLTRLVDNYSQNDGRSTAIVMGSSQSQSLGISPSMVGCRADDMSLSHICSIPGLVRQIAFPPAAAEGTLLATLPVTPTLCANFTTAPEIEMPPMCGVALPFNYWCGDITMRFEVVASVFHRATILIAWDPIRGATPTLETAIMTLQNTTVTISGNVAVDVTFPWKKPYPWGKVRQPNRSSVLASYTNAQCNGEVHVYVINPITSNGSADSLTINVYNFSKNIQFQMPTNQRVGFVRWNGVAITPPTPLALVGEVDEVEEEEETTLLSAEMVPSAEFVPATPVSFGPATNFSASNYKSFGEKYESVKHLTSKCAPVVNVQNQYTAASVSTFVGARFPNYPRPIFLSDHVTLFQSYASYFASAYLGYRGGMRYNFHVYEDDEEPTTVVMPHMWTSTELSSTTNIENPNVSLAIDAPHTSAISYAYSCGNRVISPNLDTVVPSLVPVDFAPTSLKYTHFPQTTTFYSRITKSPNANTHDVRTMLCAGTADDGTNVWFLGWPLLDEFV
jgi:hypothetical protein